MGPDLDASTRRGADGTRVGRRERAGEQDLCASDIASDRGAIARQVGDPLTPALRVGRHRLRPVPPERFTPAHGIADYEDGCGQPVRPQNGNRVIEYTSVPIVEGDRGETAKRPSTGKAIDELAQRHDGVVSREPANLPLEGG